jgi:hypothetical protein
MLPSSAGLKEVCRKGGHPSPMEEREEMDCIVPHSEDHNLNHHCCESSKTYILKRLLEEKAKCRLYSLLCFGILCDFT